MKPIVRFVEDPTAPPELRDAIGRAAAENAPPEMLNRVLGAAGVGMVAGGAVVSGLAHASRVVPRWAAASLWVKSASVLAIFAAGAAVGCYAVHRHDVAVVATSVRASVAAHRDHEATPADGQVHLEETAHVEEPASAEVPAVVVEAPPEAPPSPLPAEAPRRVGPAAVPRTPSAVPDETTAPPPEPAPAPSTTAGAPPIETPTEAAAPSARLELESLRAIGDAVEAHRPVDALAAIAAHRAHYPSSLFDQELLLLEAEARWARREPPVCSLLITLRIRYPRSLLRRRADALAAAARCPEDGAAP